VQRRGAGQQGADVELGGVALQHPVGEQDQAVTRPERDLLGAERATGDDPERQVDGELELLGPPVPHPQRQRVPGVDDRRAAAAPVHPHQLTGDELAPRRVGLQRVVGGARLVEQVAAAPPAVAQAADQHRRQQGRLHVVPHRVGDRQVQLVAVEGVVERVAADRVRRFQPAGHGELADSQVNALGSSLRWISAASENGVVRWAHSNRSVCRRQARRTWASARPAATTSGDPLAAGRDRQLQLEDAEGVAAVGDGHREQHPTALAVADVGPLGCAAPPRRRCRAGAPPARAARPAAAPARRWPRCPRSA
jgi:hypothetical protein